MNKSKMDLDVSQKSKKSGINPISNFTSFEGCSQISDVQDYLGSESSDSFDPNALEEEFLK